MTDARQNLLTDRQLELAFLGLYEQHKDHIGTVATLVQIQVHIFAMAERLAESERKVGDLMRRNRILRTRPDLPMTHEEKAQYKEIEQRLAAAEETNRIAALDKE